MERAEISLKTWKAIGKALCYFVLYFGMQILLGIGIGLVIGIQSAITIMSGGEMPSMQEMTQLITENTSLIAMLSNLLTIVFLLIFFKVRKQSVCQAVSLHKLPPVSLIPVVVLGISTSLLVGCVLSLLPESMLEAYAESSAWLLEGSLVIALISTVIVAPITEELVFRGLIFTRLRQGMPQVLALLITCVVFGLLHGQPIWMAYAFLLGLLLNWVYIRYRSLLANMVLHVTFNLVGIWGLPLNGAALWIVLAVSLLLVAAMIVVIARKQKTAAPLV